MDLLYRTGTYHRRPDGYGNTLVSEQKAAGIQWALLNIGADVDRNPAVWAKQRALYAQHGIPCGPWLHVRSMDDLNFLVQTAGSWGADIVGPNIEDVVEDKLDLKEVADYLLAHWVNPFGKPVHMATLPWVQNGQGWHHLSFAYLALEMFPKEGGQVYLDAWERCCQHAFTEGAGHVTLLFSTTSPRSVYPNVAHCLYTADDVTDWSKWEDSVPQPIPKPEEVPVPTPPPMLTTTKFPYTGPLYGPSSAKGPTNNRMTNKALKRAMIRLRYLDQPLGSETDDFGAELEKAMKVWWKEEVSTTTRFTGYGRESWLALRASKLSQGPNAGQWAMDSLALSYVRQDALTLVYPHPVGALSEICQDLHQTDGLLGNWAIDFCAPGGTKVVAVERSTIKKLSGRDPSQGWYGPGIFGWSIHYETAEGLRYFSTHYGSRATLKLGQVVDAGQVLGTVGHWPEDPSRSHTHLGVTHPLGPTAAKKRITEVKNARRVVA